MPKETVLARAKLNLTLDVLGKRPDGYHDLKMVMQSVALSDTLTVETGTGEDLRVRTDLSFLPNNEKPPPPWPSRPGRAGTRGAWPSPSKSASPSVPAWGAAPPMPPPCCGR